MEIELTPEVEEFLWWFIFRESENIEEMKYPVLFVMLDEVDEEEVPQASEPKESEPADDYDDAFDDEEVKDDD